MQSIFVRSALALLVPTAVVLSSCTGSGGASNSTAVLAVKVTPANPTVEGGANLAFVATAILQNGENRIVTDEPGTSWESSDTTVVQINADGTASAVNPGEAYVSAEVDGIRSPAQKVTVTAPPTPTPTPTPAPIATNVLISEVLYDALAEPSGEYIELHNPTGADIAIDNWGLYINNGGTPTLHFMFPAATTIAAGGYVTVCNVADGCGVVGSFDGTQTLVNGGEYIVLRNAGAALVDEMAYGSGDTGGANPPKPLNWCPGSATAPNSSTNGNSVSRKPVNTDGNNCNDWVNNTTPTPNAPPL